MRGTRRLRVRRLGKVGSSFRAGETSAGVCKAWPRAEGSTSRREACERDAPVARGGLGVGRAVGEG